MSTRWDGRGGLYPASGLTVCPVCKNEYAFDFNRKAYPDDRRPGTRCGRWPLKATARERLEATAIPCAGRVIVKQS